MSYYVDALREAEASDRAVQVFRALATLLEHVEEDVPLEILTHHGRDAVADARAILLWGRP